MIIGKKTFDFDKHTYIMGILNVTPDSFSDGGRFHDIEDTMNTVAQMIAEGADIIDVGGESTRPGYTMISDEEELARVVPVIREIKARFDIPVSVDTYKSAVAEAALCAGADLINDIWGLMYDPRMAEIIAENHAACCLMHNRNNMDYTDFGQDIMTDLKQVLRCAEQSGIKAEQIILDPGVGFAKTREQNLWILRHLAEFKKLGFPVLLGSSRKSVIGLTLDLPVDQRLEGTLTTTVMAALAGCAFVRVHDVAENKRAVMMTEAIMEA